LGKLILALGTLRQRRSDFADARNTHSSPAKAGMLCRYHDRIDKRLAQLLTYYQKPKQPLSLSLKPTRSPVPLSGSGINHQVTPKGYFFRLPSYFFYKEL
jgi:hypothetical protein